MFKQMNCEGEVESCVVLSLILCPDWPVADFRGLSQSFATLQNAGNGAVERRVSGSMYRFSRCRLEVVIGITCSQSFSPDHVDILMYGAEDLPAWSVHAEKIMRAVTATYFEHYVITRRIIICP